MKEFNWK